MKASICPVADVPAEGAKPVSFFGRDYLVYRAGGEPRAVFNACVHLGGPLERRGDHFVCPWHGARFDAATGRCAHGPQGTQAGLLVLPTRVEDGMLTYVYGESITPLDTLGVIPQGDQSSWGGPARTEP